MPMNEVPNEGMLDRHIEWIVECKDAVQALRLTTKQAKAHREKCCSVLGAALAAALALEQAIYSCALNVAKSQELQRLYAAVVAAVELAQQRVQVYGTQSRMRKYTSLPRRAAIDNKFSQIVARLDDLTKQVWALSAGDSPDPAGTPHPRVHVNTISSAAAGPLSTGLMARSRLRRGCQCHTVYSVLYVGPSQGRLHSASNAGQVWWFLGSISSGKVFVHDLASASTKELQAFQSKDTVACMQVDSQGYVWMGFKGGLIQVWDPQTRSCVCKMLSTSAADARVLSADADSNSMWLGTDTGMVSQLTLTARKVDSRLVYSIDTVQTLQLAQVSSLSPGLVTSAATSTDALSPFAARHLRQLPTPFSEAPRQLTLSSSASSYRGSNGGIELVQNPLLQPPHASFPASAPLESRVLNPSSAIGQMTEQPLSSQPLLGTATQRPLGPPPRHPPGRAFSAELMHGNPNQRPGSPPLLSRPPSLRRSGSSSPADSTRLEGGLPQMQRQSSMQRQGSVQSAGSFRSTAGRGVSASAGSTSGLAPVHAILVLGGRVITSSGFEPESALKEWSSGGALLTTHPCCELGHCTCITAVPELLQIPTSAQAQTLTPPSLLLSYKPPGSATWQMLTGHRTGHMKLWQTSHQERFQPLAVIRTARNSPVQSLVILPSLHLVCVGHLDGCIGLYITPNPGSPRQCIPACQIDGGLPALTMPSAVFEAHRSGLQQCVAGDTGLVSLGAFGSIMVWPRAELQGTLSKAGLLASARSSDDMPTSLVAEPMKQHLSRHLERAFTPRSARAVASALDQLTHQLVQEEQAQAHQMPPALAALQRGDPISAQDTPQVLREVMQMLTLSHADSNEAPLPAHTPLIPPVGSSLYPTPVPSLRNASQDFDAAPPRRLHRAVSGPAQGYSAQPQYSQRSKRYSADLELHSRQFAMQSTGDSSAEPSVRDGIAYNAVQQTSGNRNAAQQAQQRLYDSQGYARESQHAEQQQLFDVAHGPSGEAQARRVSFEEDAAALNSQTRVPQPTELSHAEPPVVKAVPPPTQADAQREAQVQSPVLHSMLYQPGASSRRVSSASYGSPAGSSGSYRASSQLLPLDLHPSDPLSVHDLPQQNPPNPTLTHANPVSDTPSQASLTQSRLMRKSTEAPNSMDSVSVEQPGSPGTHVVQSGSKKQGGVGVTAGAGVQPSPDRAAMSVLQGREVSPMTTSPLPKSQSHANLRQGLDWVSSESSVSVEPDRAVLAASAAQSMMRRSKSKLSMDTLATVESMNCPIIEYSQLEIKRKIGDGSIGQVYLGKWQETDVAIKVLTEIQNLSTQGGAHPKDTAARGGAQASHPGNVEDGTESHGWGTDDDSSIGQDSGAQTPEDNKEALKTLEREVSIMSAIRHPNVVLFMGLCLEPPCIVTEFCARGSLYDVLKKARSTPAFAQQLDWSRRLSMALDAAKGVLQLHSHKPPILHRDLKSPNMVVDRHWRVKVTDFNLSRMVSTGSNNASVTSLLANNPRWLAPEVVSKHDYSKAADVYSFGIILWEMMTWRLPWEDLNPFQIMLVLTQKHERPELPPLETLPGQPLPGIEDYLQLMQDCWHEDPSQRPRFEDIIISLRGLLESAANRHKLQKTLTAVPRLSTSCAVAPNMNKLPVVGQTPFGGPGTDPQQTPSPLDGVAKPGPLQVYETHRPFFGSTPAGGLDIVTSAANDPKRNANANSSRPTPGGQSQQTLLAAGSAALKGKSRSPSRRHTFNGTATFFGDEFNTAPSIFIAGASGRIGGVHAKYNAGDAADPVRRKSMSAHRLMPDLAADQQPLPEWILRQWEAASRGHSRLAQPPISLHTGPASTESQDVSAAFGNLDDAGRGAVLNQTSGSGDSGGSQAVDGQTMTSRPKGGAGTGSGSFHKDSSQAPPCSLTPFSAFAQHSQKTLSRSSSGSAESDNPEGPSAERKASGGLASKRSGSFGGRGAALGFMMAAQQQWRQDSFTKAAERRRNEQSSEAGRSGHSSLLSDTEQPAVQHVEAEAAPGASNQSSLAQHNVTGFRMGSTQQQPSAAGTEFKAQSTAGSRGFALPASAGTAVHSELQSAAGPGGFEPPFPGVTAGQAAKASGDRGVTRHQAVQSASKAPVLAAMLNPFLAAAQQWRETSSDGSTDQSHHSSEDAAALPEQTSRSNPIAATADSAAIAEQWLAARQELLEHPDQGGRSGANQGGGSGANQSGAPAKSTTADLQPGRGQSSSHTAQQDSAQQDSEHRHDHIASPFQSSQGPKRRMSLKAEPPPEKGSFQNSPPVGPPSGVESSSSSTSIASQHSYDFNKFPVSSKPVPKACRPPPSRRASFSPGSISQRLDTIQSDSSAEALAQHASTKSSSASAASSQLTHATAIVDLALKESVSGSGNHSEHLPSLLLSKELDDVPFQTRLQTVIEGLEQVNSPSKEGIAAQSGTQILHADGRITVASPEAKNNPHYSPFAAAQAAESL